MKFAPPTVARVADLSSLALILGLGAYGVFCLPYSFPSKVPVFDTPAYNLGFNNGIAVLVILGLLAALCARNLWWRDRAPEPADKLLWTGEPDGPSRPPRMSRAIFVLFAGIYVALTCFLYSYIPHLEDFGEAAGAIARLRYALHFDGSPYRDFDFSYGPLLLYFPIAVIKLVTGMFYSTFDFGYLVSLLAAWLVGLWSLFCLVDHFRVRTVYRVLIFSALAIAGYDLGFGLAGTMLRYVTPFAVALALHKAANRLVLTGDLKPVAKLCGLVSASIFLVFAISLEFGFVFGIATAIYCGHRAWREGRVWLVPLATAPLTYGLWLLLFPGSLDRVFGAGRNFSNFPIVPAVFIVLYILSVLWVIPILLRPALSPSAGSNASFLLLWAVLVVGLIPASLGRCEHKHCLLNGLGVFIIILPVLAAYRPRVFPLYAALFVMVFGVVWRVVDVVDYAPNFVPMRLNLAGVLPPDTIDERAIVRGLDLEAVKGVALPMTVDRHTRRFLLESGRLAPQYYTDYGTVATEKELARKLADLKKATCIVVPAHVKSFKGATDADLLAFRWKQQEQTDVRHSIWLSTLFLYPLKFHTKHLPFDPMVEESRHIAEHYEVIREAHGYLLMKAK